jgi:hypothetical protein
MTFEYLKSEISNYRTEAKATQKQAENYRISVQNDPKLSDEYKNEEIQRAGVTFKQKLAALKDGEMVAIQSRKDALVRDLFGYTTTDPSNIIAYRDAQDRAERLENQTAALTVLTRAQQSGDKSLASAVLLRAFDAGWDQVALAYGKDNPGTIDKLHELNAVNSMTQSNMQRAMDYASFY